MKIATTAGHFRPNGEAWFALAKAKEVRQMWTVSEGLEEEIVLTNLGSWLLVLSFFLQSFA